MLTKDWPTIPTSTPRTLKAQVAVIKARKIAEKNERMIEELKARMAVFSVNTAEKGEASKVQDEKLHDAP